MKLHYKIILFMTIILTVVIGGIGFLTFRQVEKTVETQMGNNAMDLAVTIASMDTIKETLGTTKDYRVIQNTVESFRKKTRFQYIIVMDMEGIKYSYPIEYDLGKKYISGGEERVLKNGEAYISADKNVLISAIRAFVPVYHDGKQVGAVLVGLLTNTVYEEIRPHIMIFKLTLIIGLFLAIISAMALSYNIKRTIFGLEPKEIALLLGQREIILHNLKYSILAVDKEGKLMLFNKGAKKVFDFHDEDIGKSIWDINSAYTAQVKEVLKTKEPIYDQELKVCPEKILLCSHTPLTLHKDQIIGVVSSFEDLTEVRQMAEKLTGFRKLTYALRAQSHEFMNKLHTISGLIQLEEYDKAIDYISDISREREEISGVLNNKIKNSLVTAILLAKYNKASEAKIHMEIDPNSNLTKIPKNITEDEVCSIIGNLIENAMDELVKFENGKIVVRLSSDDKGLNIWIQDNGPGIKEEIRDKIFQRGVTTKSGNRGFGLNNVKRIIDSAGGTIELLQGNGTTWNIHIPMQGVSEDD